MSAVAHAGRAGRRGAGPAGGARHRLSLSLDRDTRAALVATACHEGGAAALDVATRGTVYYGAVFGTAAATDVHYAIGMGERLNFWTRQGGDGWHYRGDFDTRGCVPPVPVALYTAWGLSSLPESPGGPSSCGPAAGGRG
ncbi:hypothetical protein ACWDLG_11660 [Nonomuraea sp. NPDC003727]